MKKIILLLSLTLSMFNIAIAADGNAAAGKDKSAMCAACHGADGNSLVPMYPKLASLNANYIAKQLADFKAAATSGGKTGRNDPIMGGMVMTLSEQDMADLGAFFASQKRSDGAGTADAAGQKLFFGGKLDRNVTACAACHAQNGHGMPAAGFPSLASQNAEYIKIQLEKFRSASRSNDRNAIMRKVAAGLSDSDIAAVSQYIASIK